MIWGLAGLYLLLLQVERQSVESHTGLPAPLVTERQHNNNILFTDHQDEMFYTEQFSSEQEEQLKQHKT